MSHGSHRTVGLCWLLPLLLNVSNAPGEEASSARRVRVSENQRFLIRADGGPFFYLGDTAWELLHRLNRDEADEYLRDRADKQFTVIQTVALAELDGLNAPNAYGHLPLIDHDPRRPDVRDGPDNDYWDHVDWIVNRADELGLAIGLLPTWGDKWNAKWGVGPVVFDADNAQCYGQWLASRYRDKPIIWILGGDRNIETNEHRQIIEAMAEGIEQGCDGRQLITFHPQGGEGSSRWFHDASWLDFNMRQNGHQVQFDAYRRTSDDYRKNPIKPVIDGEPLYEDHPIAFDAKQHGYSLAADVRRAAYWNVFSGACGHTYGHHSVWQMYSPEREPVNRPLLPWRAALHQPGSGQMRYLRQLIESRPFLTRVPDDSIIVVDDAAAEASPGAGRLRMVATRDEQRTFAMIYSPAGRRFQVRPDAIDSSEINAWWYDPRNGEASSIADVKLDEALVFSPPDAGEYVDWVLVLDDAKQGYPAPGRRQPAFSK